MNSEVVFLRSLAEDPDDRTTALVFADWLEDQEDLLCSTRAELLRIGVALADWVPDVDQRERLQDREQELLLAHQEAWLGLILPFCHAWRLVRGLPRVTMKAEVFLSAGFAGDAGERLRQTSVQHLRLEDLSEQHMAELAEAAYLENIAVLDLSGNGLNDAALASLLRSPHLSELTALDLSNNRISDVGFLDLLKSSRLSRLRRLGLRNNRIRHGANLELLREGFPWLRELDLQGNDPDARFLAIVQALRALREREKASPPDRPRRVVNSIGMQLALIPAGSFHMGSPDSEEVEARSVNGPPGSDERPRHRVTLTQPFYLGVYPITQHYYEAVMGANPAGFNSAHDGSPDHPVERVTWIDAERFCERLSALPEERAAGRCYRLPTEAEWEYACRAGSREAFTWGGSASSYQANFDGAMPYGQASPGPVSHATTPVGSYPANAFGLFDMHGNVWEWCQDWYDAHTYAESPEMDPQGPTSGNRKATRGGSWASGGSDCRAACRDFWYGTGYARNNIGFRVVMVPSTSVTHRP